MRGSDQQSGDLFSYVDIEARVPARHPLRAIRTIVNEGLASLDEEFDKLYADTGRDSIPPERLLRAALLQAFFSIRSERLLMEQLNYNLLYRWFVGLGVDDAVWDHSVFSKNRDRLLEADVAAKFLSAVLAHPQGEAAAVGRALLGRRHADRGLGQHEELPRQGWCGRAAGAGAQWRAQFPRREAQQRHACLHHRPAGQALQEGQRQGSQAVLHGARADGEPAWAGGAGRTTEANGTAERKAALEMIDRQAPGTSNQLTLGADKAYDAREFVADLRQKCVTPHVAQKARSSAIDGRTTRHAGYAVSQRKRKLVEEAFGWAKTIAGCAKVKVRGLARVGFHFTLAMAAYNLIRLPKLIGEAA